MIWNPELLIQLRLILCSPSFLEQRSHAQDCAGHCESHEDMEVTDTGEPRCFVVR